VLRLSCDQVICRVQVHPELRIDVEISAEVEWPRPGARRGNESQGRLFAGGRVR
jgi:hypothetical protein